MDAQQISLELKSKYDVYRQGTQEIKTINESVKQKKNNLDLYEKDIINIMVKVFNTTWIDESGTGAGPFIVVDKKVSEPSLKDVDLLRLFHTFLEKMRRNEMMTEDTMLQDYKAEKKKGETRDLKLVMRKRRPDGDGSATKLLEWQAFQ
jgi:hypothetical protein